MRQSTRAGFLPGVTEKLGYYVYALRDPRTVDKDPRGTVFYIGKGAGDRAYSHVRHAKIPRQSAASAKSARIRSIHDDGREVAVEIVRHGLPSEDFAYIVECAVIDALANCSATELSNIVAGHASGKHGWATLDELAYFAAAPVDIRAEMRPALLIRPRAQYRSDMTEPQLREITRKRWRVKSREYKYIFCVSTFGSSRPGAGFRA